MIEFDDVSFAYRAPAEGAGAPEGVRGIDLRVEAGRCVLVCGASGCGKTTVTRLANGLAPSFFPGTLEGRVLVDGRDVADLESWEVAACVGSVFQNRARSSSTWIPRARWRFRWRAWRGPRSAYASARTIPSASWGWRSWPTAASFRCRAARSSASRTPARGRPIRRTSCWTSRRRTWTKRPSRRCRRYLLDAKAQGAAVLVAEHRLWWLADVADEVVVMEEGRIARRFDGATFRALPSSEVRDLGLRVRALADERARERRAPGDAREPRAPLVRLRGVHASYGKREVLHGVDLDLREGEVAALVGANGAGKSTLCRTIVGLHRESAGTTTIDGEPAGPKQRLRACSMVFQDVNYQLFADSVRTEVSFGLTDAEAPDAARVDEVLDGLGLAAYAERHPATLSGGQKQRLAVAACIATGKRLLVFDEPTSGLDLGSMRTVAALVRRLADEGRAVLVVTHDLEFIGQACDKAVRVEAGRIAAEAVVEGDLQAVRELLAKG